MLYSPVQISAFPHVCGAARVNSNPLLLILPFSLLNALTLKGQGIGLMVIDSHSYSNGSASPLGLGTLPHPSFRNSMVVCTNWPLGGGNFSHGS